MIELLKKIINLLLFGNFFIALCAVAMALQTEYLLYGQLAWTPWIGFIFFATLFLYAIHRIVGLKKVAPFLKKYRYAIIHSFKSHIKFYALLGGLGALYFFFQLSFTSQILLIIPAILSLGYVLPVVRGNKRLRDFNYIKIFLIACIWAVITVIIPVLERSDILGTSLLLLFTERFLFIFAITLPFDIRDLKIDAHINVKTIPGRIGIEKTKWLAGVLLILFFMAALGNYFLGTYSFWVIMALFFSAVSSLYFVWQSDKTDGDYFFTGLMDGTMIIQFLLVLLFSL